MTERYIALDGIKDPHYGYGRLFASLVPEVAKLATVDDMASVLVHINLPTALKSTYDGQTKVCFTMWETDTLIDSFVSHLSHWDMILVPCEHNRVLFSQHHPNVKVVPLGVDTNFWTPASKPKKGPLTFMAGGSHWLRKGLDAVVDAFIELDDPSVRLFLKCIPDTIGGVPKIDHPRIKVVSDILTPIQERYMYRSADFFIAASRGEGWGMMPLQAMCLEIPVAMTDNTGHSEFAHLATRIIETEFGPAYSKPWYLEGNWHNPKPESVLESMRWYLDNRAEAHATAKANAPKARKFSWANSAKALLRAVPKGHLLDNPKRIPADLGLVPLEVKRRVKADIGKHVVDLAPGVVHMVPINVRDVIRNAGYAVT